MRGLPDAVDLVGIASMIATDRCAGESFDSVFGLGEAAMRPVDRDRKRV
jgi:hypothetical protein